MKHILCLLLFFLAIPTLVSARIKFASDKEPATQKGVIVGLPIQFDNKSSEIHEESFPHLDQIGKMLLFDRLKKKKLVIEGHSSANQSSSTYNLRLTKERADSVKLFLVTKYGIDADRLISIGIGSSHLLSGINPDDSKNQRVQFSGVVELNNYSSTVAFIEDYMEIPRYDFSFQNFQSHDLRFRNLEGARMVEANFQGSNLLGVNLNNANLFQADFSRTTLTEVTMISADLFATDLAFANLTDADLSVSILREANLNGAILVRCKLSDADMTASILTNAQFEVVSIPRVETMYDVKGLSTLFWKDSPQGLVLLREAFKSAGMRRQEREVTYAIKHSERVNNGGFFAGINYILFEITSNYGMSPLRPLYILLFLIFFFSIPYIFSILKENETKTGIFKIWDKDVDIFQNGTNVRSFQRISYKGFKAILWGLYFSLISAFHIGWRDANVGNWISRINPGEWTMKSIGWVKVVSGIQSLISVYLLALWILTVRRQLTCPVR